MNSSINGTRAIKIKFQNGINGTIARKEIFNELRDEFIFEESDNPDFILFGPYGNDIPPKGNYTRIGYFCENIKPDFSICEWAFGVPDEDDIKNYRYKRIDWHDLDPRQLIKPANYDARQIFQQKECFCNFLYGHNVDYRINFFKQLSKYKKIDAPGPSMNNMPGVNDAYTEDRWELKRNFLAKYKFTISFENYVYPAYQTEKLHHAMLANSIPIYCGDPYVYKTYNTKSFVNVEDYVKLNNSPVVAFLERHSQPNFRDIRPSFYHNPIDRMRRKMKEIGRSEKMRIKFRNFDFTPVIEKIIELDQDDEKYIETLKQPWFINNVPPLNVAAKNRWREIFNQSK